MVKTINLYVRLEPVLKKEAESVLDNWEYRYPMQ